MNANELRRQTFDKGAFGFKPDEVEACLSKAADAWETMENENKELKEEIKKLHAQIERYQEDEESVKEIIVSAQKLSSTVVHDAKIKAAAMVEEAEQKSDKMITDATAKSNKMIAEAEEQSQKMMAEATVKSSNMLKDAQEKAGSLVSDAKTRTETEVLRLKKMQKEVSAFKSNLLGIYKAHLDLITKLPEVKDTKPEPSKPVVEDMPEAPKPQDIPAEKLEKPPVAKQPAEVKPVPDPKPVESEKVVQEQGSPFRITITETKNSPNATNNANRPDFKSRFSDLKFGEQK
ncbi:MULTISPECIES: DivIVA domain-containing protein [Clostridiaceae]|uniref:DivIVA domain-containing protein n=1 Tax=Clostridium facile TaxID=2763035 RepID=A0ABR7IQ34_9CLOT|nr:MULTISPECIES: DivIVA domain-containing protein [Clostridiaceae]MBC5787241.1 DivIVA domain-containing protein [Clostridium facile]